MALKGLQAVCLLIQMESRRKCLFFKCNLQSRSESLFKRPKMNIFKIVSIVMVTYYRQRFPWTIIRVVFFFFFGSSECKEMPTAGPFSAALRSGVSGNPVRAEC